jgi:hypothetical protein
MTQAPNPGAPGTQQVQIRVDESKMSTSYANTIRTSTTGDEIVLDFGVNLPQRASEHDPVIMQFSVGSRVIMNWVGAKRLAASLQQAIAGYEQRFGEIDVNPRQPVAPTPPAP